MYHIDAGRTSEGDSVAGSTDAECLYELFNIYATWTHGDTMYSKRPNTGVYAYTVECGAVFPSSIRRLLLDLNLVEGVPDDQVDAYVAETMLRADQDGDGILSLGEFIVWFLTEAAVMLPFKRNGLASLSTAPLYNRFVYYMLVESGAGVRRKASGLQASQFLRMCRDAGITDDEMIARSAVQVASTYASSNRACNGVEAGSRLQVAQVIHALAFIAEKQKVTLESLLYRIAGNGCGSFNLRHHKTNSTFQQLILGQVTRLFLESELEQPLKKTQYECDICGKTHEQWINGDERLMKAYFHVAGMPFVPHFRIINARNIRSIFHKYNLKYNKGLPPPSTLSGSALGEDPDWDPVPDASLDKGGKEQLLQELLTSQLKAEELPTRCMTRSGSALRSRAAGATGPTQPPEPEVTIRGLRSSGRSKATSCCCQLRSMSLMEMQTFWQICWDNRTLRRALNHIDGNLTARRVEIAFTTASSIEGVYSKGLSLGVHDQPVTRDQAKQLRSCAAATVARPVAMPGRAGCDRCEAACLDAPGQIFGSRASITAAPGSGLRPVSAPPPKLRGQWSGGLRGAPSPVTFGPTEPAGKSFAHRPPVPTLSFPQFLEALRLLAEDLIGHPQVLVSVEMALWSILHDVAMLGCPLPISQKWVRAEMGTGTFSRPS